MSEIKPPTSRIGRYLTILQPNSSIFSDKLSPLRLLVITALSAFLAEAISVTFFEIDPLPAHWMDVLASAFFSTLLIVPFLYLLLLRPLIFLMDERKRAEEQVRLQSTALEAAANGIFITDAEGVIQWSNLAFTQLTGYPRQIILGKTPRFLKSGTQDQAFYQELWSTIRAGKVWHNEIQNRRMDETLYYEEQTITPVLDESGKVTHFIAIQHDISERKQAEEKIQERNQRLEELYQAELRARHTAETLRSASLALTQTLNLPIVTRTLLEYCAKLVPYDHAAVFLYEGETSLQVWAIRGYAHLEDPTRALNEYFQPETHETIRALIAGQRTIVIDDTQLESNWKPHVAVTGVRNWLGVPLVAGGRLIGLCEFGQGEVGAFTQEHVQWIEALAGQSAVVIQNAWLFEQVRAGRERLKSLSHRLVEIQENERRYIARDLHDEAGQMLTSLMIGLELLEREVHNPQAVVAGIAELNKLINQVIDNLHRLAVDLRPASLDHLGLVAALRQYIETISEKHPMIFSFQTLGIDERLPAELETMLYRIVQEALTNVIRHAQASRVDILLERRGQYVLAMIEDNGVGFDSSTVSQTDSLGLIGMRERVEMLSGRLTIESSPNHGSSIFVEVPYDYSYPGSR